ncbi:MAG: helix-turn-helix domain-containing protein [Bacteroidetes bacterium]|nr:helix-turn-helix domain-containing protein [Bacteroidota bacterium]
MDINERIRATREKKRFSQYDIAEMLNISQSAYLQIEKGKTELTLSRLTQIATALEVSVVDLLGTEGKDIEQTAKIEELEKRIEELEANLKDKSDLIQLLQARERHYSIIAESMIWDEIKDQSSNLEYGKRTYVIESKNIKFELEPEVWANDLHKWVKDQFPDIGEFSRRELKLVKFDLTNEEKYECFEHVMFLGRKIERFFEIGVVRNNELLELYEAYKGHNK